jgi:hypothetical protein
MEKKSITKDSSDSEIDLAQIDMEVKFSSGIITDEPQIVNKKRKREEISSASE